MKNEKKPLIVIPTVILYVLLSGVFLYLTFCNLNNVSIENWDEARHGISAYEMLQNNNFIENTYNYSKDLWNLKPPLSFWAESASMSIFGYSFFALRLPYITASIRPVAIMIPYQYMEMPNTSNCFTMSTSIPNPGKLT